MATQMGPAGGLDPLIQAVIRRAEAVYTKMAIRRDESQDLTRRKKNNDRGDISPIPWEDTTDVSVVALRGFLEDLLGLAHSDPLITSHSDLLPLPSTPSKQPMTPQTPASHAAEAYRSTGKAVHDENVESVAPAPIIPVSTGGTQVHLGDDFGAAEREMMHGYLKDLVILEGRGVVFLTLRRSLTFLESINQAIEKENEQI